LASDDPPGITQHRFAIKQDIAVRTAQIHAVSGDVASARATLPPINHNSLPPHSEIRDVASAAASAGKLADVKQWAQQCASPEERFAVYLGAAAGLTSKP